VEAIRDLVLDWSHPALEGITFDTLRETGWARLSIPPPSQYAPRAEGGFPTRSGKCELCSSLAEAAGDYVIPVFREGYEAEQPGTPVDPLPTYIEPERDPRFPLTLLSRSATLHPGRTLRRLRSGPVHSADQASTLGLSPLIADAG
jgi:hypothetical protein